MVVDKRKFCLCSGRVTVRVSRCWVPDKCDLLTAMARPSLSRREARAGMLGAEPAGQAGEHTANVPLSHGRYAR